MEIFDTNRLADCLGCGLIVPRQHHCFFDSHLLKLGDNFPAFFPDLISNRQEPQYLFTVRKNHDCFSLFLQMSNRLFMFG